MTAMTKTTRLARAAGGTTLPKGFADESGGGGVGPFDDVAVLADPATGALITPAQDATVAAVLAAILADAQSAPFSGAVAMTVGTNDLGGTLATIEANIWNATSPSSSIVGQLLATVRPVYLQTILPRTLSAGVAQSQLYAINRWIKSLSGTVPGIRVVDGSAAYGDPMDSNGSPRTITRVIYGQYGNGVYTYSASGLPSCVTINTATGVLTPSGCTTPSTAAVTFGVTDTGAHSGSQPWTLTINPGQPQPISMWPSGNVTGTIGIVQSLDYSYDGLHPKTAGAYAAFAPLASALTAALPSYANASSNSVDGYDATNNPKGNLLPIGGQMRFSSASGTVSGRVTGIAPDGWLIYSSDAACSPCTFTAVSSASTLADGTPSVKITYGGTAGGGWGTGVYATAYATSTTFSAGDELGASCRFEMSGAQHITNVQLVLLYTAGGVSVQLISGPIATNFSAPDVSDAAPTASYSGRVSLPVPPAGLPGATSGGIQLLIANFITNSASGAVAGVVNIGDCTLNKV